MSKIKKISFPLYLQILLGMIAGIAIGIIAVYTQGEKFVHDWIRPWGQVFIRLLQLIAIPLVFISLVKGVTGLNDIKKFSRLGGKDDPYLYRHDFRRRHTGTGIGVDRKARQTRQPRAGRPHAGRLQNNCRRKKTSCRNDARPGPAGFPRRHHTEQYRKRHRR